MNPVLNLTDLQVRRQMGRSAAFLTAACMSDGFAENASAGERIKDRSRWRAQSHIRTQLSQSRRDAVGPVLLCGNANYVSRKSLSESGKENAGHSFLISTNSCKGCGKKNSQVVGATHLLRRHFRYGNEGTNNVLASN